MGGWSFLFLAFPRASALEVGAAAAVNGKICGMRRF
jgi:hypothetical protein